MINAVVWYLEICTYSARDLCEVLEGLVIDSKPLVSQFVLSFTHQRMHFLILIHNSDQTGSNNLPRVDIYVGGKIVSFSFNLRCEKRHDPVQKQSPFNGLRH